MHAKAPLTPEGRRRLCERIEAGWTIAGAAESMGISRQTAHKWWHRYQDEGELGLRDRSSRPKRCPKRLDVKLERRIVDARTKRRVGPARLAPQLGVPASTLHRVLQRNGVSRLSDLDRTTGRVVRRIETSRPGELIHRDIKKLAKIPPGGGWRVTDEAPRGPNLAKPLGATPTFTQRSTPTPGSPTQRSTPTSKRSPCSGSGAELEPSSPPTALGSSE